MDASEIEPGLYLVTDFPFCRTKYTGLIMVDIVTPATVRFWHTNDRGKMVCLGANRHAVAPHLKATNNIYAVLSDDAKAGYVDECHVRKRLVFAESILNAIGNFRNSKRDVPQCLLDVEDLAIRNLARFTAEKDDGTLFYGLFE